MQLWAFTSTGRGNTGSMVALAWVAPVVQDEVHGPPLLHLPSSGLRRHEVTMLMV